MPTKIRFAFRVNKGLYEHLWGAGVRSTRRNRAGLDFEHLREADMEGVRADHVAPGRTDSGSCIFTKEVGLERVSVRELVIGLAESHRCTGIKLDDDGQKRRVNVFFRDLGADAEYRYLKDPSRSIQSYLDELFEGLPEVTTETWEALVSELFSRTCKYVHVFANPKRGEEVGHTVNCIGQPEEPPKLDLDFADGLWTARTIVTPV